MNINSHKLYLSHDDLEIVLMLNDLLIFGLAHDFEIMKEKSGCISSDGTLKINQMQLL